MAPEIAPGTRRASARRRRNHEATIDEIKEVAREVLAERGLAGISVSEVARRLEIVPSGLYRYFRGRDDLVSALAVDVYTELADSLEAALAEQPDADPVEQLRIAALAWRTWSLRHPVEFALVFGQASQLHYTDEIIAAANRTGALF